MYKSLPLITICKKGNADIQEYSPAITSNSGIPYPVSLNYGVNKSALLKQAVQDYKSGACVLWIENTVVEAQDTYDYFCSLIAPDDIGLLHSRFTAFDRTSKEDTWTTRLGKKIDPNNRKSHPCILVGTQVCEQSLDIDADVLYTSICPIDMFIQRVGRIWRHRKFDCIRPIAKPVVNWFGWENHTVPDIINKIDAISTDQDLSQLRSGWKSLCIYDAYVIGRTIETISLYNSINIPGDIRKLLEVTYA
jgi:CRISPR-associated endonuclease/helicase Cas3